MFLAMALYINVIAALLSVFSSLFLLSSLFYTYVRIYAISSISMQLCVTSVIKLVRRPYEKNDLEINTRSVRKISDRIFLCEHLMDYNLARLHEPTLNLSAHA